MRFAYVHAWRHEHPVSRLCANLEVSTSGYYEWRSRGPSARKLRDEELAIKIVASHINSGGSYGTPRIHQDLIASGEQVSRKRVARICRERGLVARRKRRRRPTRPTKDAVTAANILNREFTVEEPNTVWTSDITQIETTDGWRYLAVVLELYSRCVVGWAISDRQDTALVLKALENAVEARRPGPSLLFHSDRGAQYTSWELKEWLDQHGFIQSMSRPGNCYDNAVTESFFATLKKECVHPRVRWSARKLEREVFLYIDGFYNQRRRHSAARNMSPLNFERTTLDS